MGWLILSVWLLVMLVGLVALALGLRGTRVTPYEVCRACHFDLRGLTGSACPECGVDLVPVRSRRAVRRKGNPRPAVLGAVLVVAAAAVPGAMVADSVLSGRVTAAMPTWTLVLQVRALGTHTPDRVTQELVVRCGAGGVSDGALRAAAIAITRMQPGEPLPAPMNQLVADAAAKGLISKDLLAQHVVIPNLLYLQIPERIRVGEPFARYMGDYGDGKTRVPLDNSWMIVRRLTGIEVDGVAIPEALMIHRQGKWESGTTYSPAVTTTMPPPPAQAERCVPGMPSVSLGKHTVRLRWSVEVYHGPTDAAPGRTTAWSVNQVEGIKEGAPLVRLVQDEAFKRDLTTLLEARLFSTPGGGGWSVLTRTSSSPFQRPAGVEPAERYGGAWDVFFDINGERQHVGKIKLLGGTESPVPPMTFHIRNVTVPGQITTCRAVLVPDERFAADRTALDVMPEGEILLDVTIR
ncbi:MAG TPA: hypothetical protein VEB22_07340 [Phycisphaerales bacterium]|nr:hypothetical protein [Phycisphaerales bacterium]